jgi:hypothetical protein
VPGPWARPQGGGGATGCGRSRLARWLAELDADRTGADYRPEDVRWPAAKAPYAAAHADADLCRDYADIASFLAVSGDVFARPGVRRRALELGAGAPRYPLAGPSRAELLAV